MLGVRGRPVRRSPWGEGRAAGRPVAAAARRRAWTTSRPGSPSCGRTSSTPTCAGTSTLQQRVRTAPSFSATAVDRDGGGFETMGSLAPPAARGWEYLTGTGWDWDTELARLPEWLAEKAAAPVGRTRPVRPGDRPVQPVAHHPRVGRARHRVRPGDRLRGRLRRHQLRHAGPARQRCATARRSCTSPATAPTRTASRPIGFDDDGVATSQWDLVRDGDPGRLPARPHLRPTPRPGPQQRLRLRRLPAPRAAAADGERVAAAGHRPPTARRTT